MRKKPEVSEDKLCVGDRLRLNEDGSEWVVKYIRKANDDEPAGAYGLKFPGPERKFVEVGGDEIGKWTKIEDAEDQD